MSAIVLRWGVPAFAVVVGGTFAALAMTSDRIHDDLATRITAELAANNLHWPAVTLAGRDVTLSGAVSDRREADLAAGLVASIRGVRTATLDTTIADLAQPYPFVVAVAGGNTTVSGGVPDAETRNEVLALVGAGADDQTRLLAGVPDRTVWLEGVRYLGDYVREFDEGEAALSGLQVTISGRARDYDAYDALLARGELNAPAGLTIGYREVTPPLAAPYQFNARFDGAQLTLSGVVPDEDFITTLTALVPDGIAASTSLVLASGAAPDFEQKVAVATENLLKLHDGSFSSSDAELTFSGAPTDRFVGEEVRVAMTPLATSLDLAPAPVAEYWFGVDKTESLTTLEGYVPDAETLSRLSLLPDVGATGLAIGGGAPERFVAGVDYVLALLPRLSTGALNIQGTTIILRGRAATSADFEAVEALLAEGAPQGFTLGSVDIVPPLAAPYQFAADKAADGTVTFTGFVPNAAARRTIAEVVPGSVDQLALADGAPDRFVAELVKALEILGDVEAGSIRYANDGWTLAAEVPTPQAAEALQTAFNAAGLASSGWELAVDQPEPEQPLAVVSPYQWRLEKADDGAVTVSGYLPSSEFRAQVATAFPSVEDKTQLALGAAPDFAGNAGVGLEAMALLRTGSLDLSNGQWTLKGTVPTTAERHAVERLVANIDPDGLWAVAIQADDAAPLVVPFKWEARKGADGRFQFSGYVPTEQLRRFLAVRAGKVAVDGTLVGSGEPEDFARDALAGIEALAALDEGTARFDGRNWHLAGQPASDAAVDKVSSLLSGREGQPSVWSTELQPVKLPVPTPAPEAETELAPPDVPAVAVEPQPADFAFRAGKADGEPVAFSGIVPDEASRQRLAELTGGTVADTLTVGQGLPVDFATQSELGTEALAQLVDGEFGLASGRWFIKGRAESSGQKREVERLFASAPAAAKWTVRIDLLPPLELCQRHVWTLASRNAILFQSGSALLTESSAPVLDELATYLGECPEADVNVEGHTDSDGDADQNLALSVARAEAVVEALLTRGVDAGRLFAIGYGESLPIADNATRAGKQANRRIAFTVAER
jgi:outer membrane protein OmpA-like peptidoglycan-associated protein